MPSHVLCARRPRDRAAHAGIDRDPERIAAFLEDAAHVPGGAAAGVVFPRTEADVAEVLRREPSVLPIGAQSSLTGGATPTGGIVLSTARLTQIDLGDVASTGRVHVDAGVTLADLETALAAVGAWYPPAPTYLGASVGGTIATNAAGAATFKYGTTRAWVDALTIVLASGDVLDVVRGATRAHADGYFELQLADRRVRLDVPSYRLPGVPKVSAGYYAAPEMDLIDLFIGAEGTLGVVTRASLRVVRPRPAMAMVLVMCAAVDQGLRLVGALRTQSRETWQSHDPAGIDVAAIEHMDRRCLQLLRDDGVDRALAIQVPVDAAMALLLTLELPSGTNATAAFSEIAGALDPATSDSGLVRFCRLLAAHGVLEAAEIALPGDRRQAALLAFREAVPAAVNRRVGQAQRAIDPRIQKMAADVIVPFERLGELLEACAHEFATRALDGAVWGHVSDGNLHPNVVPAQARDVEAGRAAVLALGRTAMRLGGAPCAEHGVGRNAAKRQLMAEMIGEEGLAAMQQIKRALDPAGVIAPGVLGLTPAAALGGSAQQDGDGADRQTADEQPGR